MKFFNTLSKSLEEFVPINKNMVNIYVCGITPYDTTHLGHAFTYISFDVLIRYLKFKGCEINYTQNVTDINDRDNDILKRAQEKHTTWEELTEFWTKKFLDDMEFLNWVKPNNYLYASQHLETMISLIQKLLKNQYAYEANNSIYLDITKDDQYGKLSKLDEKEMLKIAKDFDEDIENPDKKSPLDVTLWRGVQQNQAKHIPSFNSPFGKGRPGWHIECSAMGICSLGEQIDIHGGGRDLIFPHHEAEIAQSEKATGKIPFAKFFIHTGQISYEGQKMSKSLGNLLMVSELSKKYSSNAIRFLLLSHNYNDDWEFFEKDIEEASRRNQEIEESLNSALKSNPEILKKFEMFMDNNLAVPQVLKLIYDNKDFIEAKEIYKTLGFIIESS